MFPISWNKAFRKKDGTLVNMEDIGGGGGGSELPPHTIADAGKVLGVDENGNLAWVNVSGGGNRFAKISTRNTSLVASNDAKEVTT